MRFDHGSLLIGRAHGAPIAIHWSAFALAAAEAALKRSLVLPLCFAASVLLHELAHAGVVRWLGGRVVYIQVHFLGGTCEADGALGRRKEALVAGAGPLANLAVLAAVLPLLRPGLPGWLHGALSMLAGVNLLLAVANLLPVAPLDGATFWREFRPISFRQPPPRGPVRPAPPAPPAARPAPGPTRRGGLRVVPGRRDD